MTRLRLLGLGLGLGFGLCLESSACVLPNPDHCLHLALDSHAWCLAQYGDDRPYCSPCAAEQNGCVSAQPSPSECSTHSRQPETETDTETDTETGAEPGTTSGTDTGS